MSLREEFINDKCKNNFEGYHLKKHNIIGGNIFLILTVKNDGGQIKTVSFSWSPSWFRPSIN